MTAPDDAVLYPDAEADDVVDCPAHGQTTITSALTVHAATSYVMFGFACGCADASATG